MTEAVHGQRPKFPSGYTRTALPCPRRRLDGSLSRDLLRYPCAVELIAITTHRALWNHRRLPEVIEIENTPNVLVSHCLKRRVAELTVSVRFAHRLQQSTGWSFGRDRFKRKRNEGRNPRCERRCGTQAALTRGGPGWASGSVKSVVFIGVGDRASAAAHIAFLNRKGQHS